MKIKILFIALLVSSFSWGQTTVTIGGGASVICPATPTATWTTPPTGVTFSNWSRGSGVACATSATALSGSAFNTANAATSYSGNRYYSFTITADAATTFTLNSIVWSTAISSGLGNFTIQYINNGGALTTFGTAAQTGTTTNTFSGSVSVAASTSIVIYLIPAGTGASGTTVRLVNGSTVNLTASPSSCTPAASSPIGAISGSTTSCGASTLTYTGADSGTCYWQTTATGTNSTAPNAATLTYSAGTAGPNNYFVRNYNGSCWSTAISYSVTVNTPVVITTQPSNQSATVGGSATFSVAATGTGLSYQWEFSTNGGSSWTSVGTNSASYTTPPTVIGDSGTLYHVIISGTSPCTPVTSASATLYVCALTGALAAGTYAIPSSCFLTVASAASYLNTNGIAGAVVFNIAAGHSETAPIKGIGLGSATLNPTLSSTNTITFQKVSGTVTLNAGIGTGTPASASPDGILYLNGADYVTLDGLTFTDGNTTNNASMEFGVAFFKLNAGDGCNNNTVKNCTFNMQRVNGVSGSGPMLAGSWAIEVLNSTPAAATTILTPTNGGTLATNGTNSGNMFYNNTTNGGYGGIGLSGYLATLGVGPAPTAATFLGDLNNDIGGTPAAGATTGNSILNYGGSSTNTTAGIRVNNQWGVNISNNTVNNNNGSGVNHTTTLRGIYAQAGTSANATISYNSVTVSSGATVNQLSGIENGIGATAASNTVSINNNTIVTSYTTATSGPTYGLYNISASADTLNMNNNTVTLSSAATSGLNYPINVSGAVATSLNINLNTLTASLSAASTAVTVRAIFCSGGAATCATSISNNNFNGLSYTGATGSTGTNSAIYHTGTPLTCVISNNNFNNLSVKSTGDIYLIYNSYTAPANGSKTVSGNTIVTGFARTAGGIGIFKGYYDFGSSPSTVSHTIINNNFSNITINSSNSGELDGIDSEDYLTSNPALTIANNTMSNWTNGSGSVYAIYANGFAGTSGSPNVVSGNTINNISTIGAAVVYGIFVGSTTAYLDVYNNSVSQLKGLTDATGGNIIGIFSAGATGVVKLYKNNVNGLSGIGSATTITGIYSTAAATRAIYNNLIGDLTATASSSLRAVEGISVNGGTTSNIYYNTVYFTGTSSAANFGSSALYADNTSTILDLRNNILINTSTPKGTGRTTAFTTPLAYNATYYVSTSNNNLFYAGTPGASNLIFYDGTNSDQTLAAFQTRVGPTSDVDSVTEPFFNAATYFESIIGSNSLYLKPKSLCNVSSANNAGASIGSITDDYNSAVRDATTPDIGAWEFDSHGKRWNGTIDANWNTIKNWTPKGIPSATDCVFISAGTPNAAVISGDNYNALALNLTVDDGASLTVNSGNTAGLGNTITVTDSVIVSPPTGSFIINNNSSLVQITDVGSNVNTGNIIYNRTATAVNGYDYVYWSSPVTGQSIDGLYSSPAMGLKYSWNPTVSNINTVSTGTSGNWQFAAGSTMTPAKGYIVRGSTTYSMAATNIPAIFTGVPSNGVISAAISRGTNTTASQTGASGVTVTNYDDNWNLVGNPYPSAIKAIDFLNAATNPNIQGFINLWTHGTAPVSTTSPFYNTFAANYTSNDYITYNAAGASSGPSVFNGYIGAGQGFFVSMIDGAAGSSTVIFNNSMRNRTHSNSQFYKATEVDENNRIWLDLVDSNNESVRTLVGYFPEATVGLDRMYDAFRNIANDKNIYSLAENTTVTIQGRPMPFDENDQVPIGVHIMSAGNYKIAIAAVDGLFEHDQPIFLEDKELNLIYDLRQNPYNFSALTGIFNDRFVLRYTNTALGNPDFETSENVMLAANHGELTIKSFIENIQEVTVYDVLGRQLFFAKGIGSTNFVTSNISASQQTLIVKIKLENGMMISRKIIL